MRIAFVSRCIDNYYLLDLHPNWGERSLDGRGYNYLVTDIPAAWYPDPAGTPGLRWWDGATWTEHLAVPQLPAPVVATPYAPSFQAETATDYGPLSPSRFDGVSYRTPDLTYTAAVWWVALWPVWGSILFVLTGAMAAILFTLTGAMAAIGGPVGSILAAVVNIGSILFAAGMAMRDRRQLADAGFERPPSAWWWLLGPALGYLIARGIYMYQQKRRGWAPAIVLGAITLAWIAVSVLAALLGPYGSASHLP